MIDWFETSMEVTSFDLMLRWVLRFWPLRILSLEELLECLELELLRINSLSCSLRCFHITFTLTMKDFPLWVLNASTSRTSPRLNSISSYLRPCCQRYREVGLRFRPWEDLVGQYFRNPEFMNFRFFNCWRINGRASCAKNPALELVSSTISIFLSIN